MTQFCKPFIPMAFVASITSSIGMDYMNIDSSPEEFLRLGNLYREGTTNTQKNPELSFQSYKSGAEQGHPECQYWLANAYALGHGVDKNTELAIRWYGEAINQGHAKAQYWLAVLYHQDLNDLVKAHPFYQQAANRDVSGAQFMIGWMYYEGHEKPKDYKLAFDWFTKAATPRQENGKPQEDENAMYFLGLMYAKGHGVPKDVKKAFTFFEKSAKAENVEAIYNLGIHYFEGLGVSQDANRGMELILEASKKGSGDAYAFLGKMYCEIEDYREALDYFTEGVKLDNAECQCCLGSMFGEGMGVPKNLEVAFRLIKIAAEKNNTSAQFLLGHMYFYGNGTPKDYTAAFKWMRKAANDDHIEAQILLGSMYYFGYGTTKNFVLAHKWYLDASNQGNLDAMHKLAILYTKGEGVRENQEVAFRYFKKAADKGHSLSQQKVLTMYSVGLGTERNMDEARKYHQMILDGDNEELKKAWKEADKFVKTQYRGYSLDQLEQIAESGREDFINLLRGKGANVENTQTQKKIGVKQETRVNAAASNKGRSIPASSTVYPNLYSPREDNYLIKNTYKESEQSCCCIIL